MRRSLVAMADGRAVPLPDNSVESVVCDPPYNLGFMGRKWDTVGGPQAFQAWCESWAREALRVLKPGGHLLAMGSSRTAHRLACGIEDAGFELRDRITVLGPEGQEVDLGPAPAAWLYSSGFPKSKDADRAVDMQLCQQPGRHFANALPPEDKRRPDDHVCPDTPEGDAWAGWGTALKPAHEPIVCARKPLAGTVAANVLEHGTGALNIDATRIGAEMRPLIENAGQRDPRGEGFHGKFGSKAIGTTTFGRWPPNVAFIHAPSCQPVGVRKVRSPVKPYERGSVVESALYGDGMGHIDRGGLSHGYADPDGTETVQAWECEPDCPVGQLDAMTADLPGGGGPSQRPYHGNKDGSIYGKRGTGTMAGFPDKGGASRFFYTAKAGRDERVTVDGERHPTVKPLALMRWLVRLVTPPSGIVLDLFAGSGTTGEAAMLEGFRSVLLDNDWISCQAAFVRTDPFVRRRRKVTIREDGRAEEQGEDITPRLF